MCTVSAPAPTRFFGSLPLRRGLDQPLTPAERQAVLEYLATMITSQKQACEAGLVALGWLNQRDQKRIDRLWRNIAKAERRLLDGKLPWFGPTRRGCLRLRCANLRLAVKSLRLETKTIGSYRDLRRL